MPVPVQTAAAGTVIPVSSLITPGGQIGYTGPMGDGMPVGTVYSFTSVTPPAGSMIADGSAISRTTYPALFTLIGTTYGAGDGSTTFNIPDLRSKFILGNGQGAGLSNRVLATTGGEENHVLTTAELASHSHTLGGHYHYCSGVDHLHGCGGVDHLHGLGGHVHASGGPAAINYGTTSPGYQFYQCTSQNTGGPNTGSNAADRSLSFTSGAMDRSPAFNSGGPSGPSDATGSGTAHNTMPPYLVLVYMIKVAAGSGPSATAPLADTTQPGLLCKVSGLNTDYIRGDNTVQSLASGIVTVAPNWRSYNSIGNPNFEIDARTAGAGVASSAQNGWITDRWNYGSAGTNRGSVKQMAAPTGVVIAGTNFCLSGNFLRYTLTTQESSFAAGSYIQFVQIIEGIRLRELLGGPTSFSIVARSSVANTVFSLYFKDGGQAYTICKLCTIPNANAWTLIQLPNIPVFTPSATWNITPGSTGALLGVTIATGSTYTASANDVWVAGSFNSGPGSGNFAANPVNSTFDLGWIQHEPLATPSGILDKDYQTNQRECWRYYLDTRTGTGTVLQLMAQPNNPYAFNGQSFPVPMAKTPTVVVYQSGNANQTNEHFNGTVHTIDSYTGVCLTGWAYVHTTANYTYNEAWITGYTADTAW